MKPRSEAEARAWMGAHGDPHNPINVVGTITLISGDGRGAAGIWRYGDEPGAWRDAKGRLLPVDQLRGIPGIEGEMEQRQLAEDQERASAILEQTLAARGRGDVLETRGAYELSRIGDQFTVTSGGAMLLPAPTTQAIARSVFHAVAPAMVVPEGTALDAMRLAAQ